MALPLVVDVDGSESSVRATDWAADEAVRHGSALRLVYASVWQFRSPPRREGDCRCPM